MLMSVVQQEPIKENGIPSLGCKITSTTPPQSSLLVPSGELRICLWTCGLEPLPSSSSCKRHARYQHISIKGNIGSNRPGVILHDNCLARCKDWHWHPCMELASRFLCIHLCSPIDGVCWPKMAPPVFAATLPWQHTSHKTILRWP